MTNCGRNDSKRDSKINFVSLNYLAPDHLSSFFIRNLEHNNVSLRKKDNDLLILFKKISYG